MKYWHRWFLPVLLALATLPYSSPLLHSSRNSTPAETANALRAAAPAPRDLYELAAAYLGLRDAPRAVHADPPDYQAGRVDTFWVTRPRPVEHFQVAAELQLVGRHAYWYVEQGQNVSEAGLRRSAEVFDARIYPEVRRLVGSEAFPGIDNDPRITIFNGEVPGVAGYVSSADSHPRAINPYSNEREMVYLNLRALELGTPGYLSVLAHEFTHLVHWNVNPSEDTWMKEGLADLVAWLVFPERSASAATFFSAPDVQLTSWSDGEAGSSPMGAHYQAATWFLRYFVDRFGEGALAALMGRDSHGPASFDAFFREAGRSLAFDDLFRDWVVANAVGQQTPASLPGYAVEPPGRPQTRRLAAGQAVEETVAQYGAHYYELDASSSPVLEFWGAATIPIVATHSYAGSAMWYAGRVDTATSTMTRAFDLSGLMAATLEYSVWYDVERDYDFAYVSASTDGGRTWTLLESPSMTWANATGTNLGVGYNGVSGGGAQPEWIREAIDLHAFVGGPVMLRFSYITDDALLREGVVIDEIRIEALGYADGAEEDSSDWILAGWARVGAELSQTWSLQVVEVSPDGVRLERMPVDVAGRGFWSSGGHSIDRGIVAISGTAPITLQRSPYRLAVRGP